MLKYVIGGIMLLILGLSLSLYFSIRHHKKVVGALRHQLEKLETEKKILVIEIEKQKELERLRQLKGKEEGEVKQRQEITKKIGELEKKEKQQKEDLENLKKIRQMPIGEAVKEASRIINAYY